MNVDHRTLVDLGILPRTIGDWPLQTLLDQTHSSRALSALQQLLASPLHDPASIKRRQRVMRQLPRILSGVHWLECMRDCDAVDHYLSSNYVVVPKGAIAATVFRSRHRDIVDFVERSLTVVARHAERCAEIRRRIDALPADDPVVAGLHGAFDQVAPLTQCFDASRTGTLGERDERIREKARSALERSVAALHQLDALVSLASLTTKPGFVFPTVGDDTTPVRITDARHPLVAGATPNGVAMDSHERVLFLTGPNMAGKSTLLRTIGIVVHFAHLGLPVPAASATLPCTGRLIASLNAEDSITRGESLYLVEVRRVRSVVAAVRNGETVLALLDEAFRGTNVKDAAEAMGLLVDGLASAPAGTFVLASHLAEVARERTGDNRIAMWYMHVDSSAADEGFTYTMQRGVSDVRLGMRLLEREGVAEMLRTLRDGGC